MLNLTFLVLKYVQNFFKIYKTECTDVCMRPWHSLYSLPWEGSCMKL